MPRQGNKIGFIETKLEQNFLREYMYLLNVKWALSIFKMGLKQSSWKLTSPMPEATRIFAGLVKVAK